MRLSTHRHLDALCGEYLLGSLRGAPRRRFERALREEPGVALRLAYWEDVLMPHPSPAMAVAPPRDGLMRLRRALELDRYRLPWSQRIGLWRAWAAGATTVLAALVLAFALDLLPAPGRAPAPVFAQIARLDGASTQVLAERSADGRILSLRASRPVLAGPTQSYELWLIPTEGGAPISVAVLGALDARIEIPPALIARMTGGAKLAVSVEPAGGSPTGAPTGAVILVGTIET